MKPIHHMNGLWLTNAGRCKRFALINYSDKIQMNELYKMSHHLIEHKNECSINSKSMLFAFPNRNNGITLKSPSSEGAKLSSRYFKSSRVWIRQLGVNVLFLLLYISNAVHSPQSKMEVSNNCRTEHERSNEISTKLEIRVTQIAKEKNSHSARCQQIQINDRKLCVWFYSAI